MAVSLCARVTPASRILAAKCGGAAWTSVVSVHVSRFKIWSNVSSKGHLSDIFAVASSSDLGRQCGGAPALRAALFIAGNVHP
jgi:hypothetical protein